MSKLVEQSWASGGSATLSGFGHDPLRHDLAELHNPLIEGARGQHGQKIEVENREATSSGKRVRLRVFIWPRPHRASTCRGASAAAPARKFRSQTLLWRPPSAQDELDQSPNILPDQLPTRRYMSPESRLAAALIEQAISDSRDIHVASGLRRSALKWLSGAPALLSFDQACALAGIDVQALKGAIARGHCCG